MMGRAMLGTVGRCEDKRRPPESLAHPRLILQESKQEYIMRRQKETRVPQIEQRTPKTVLARVETRVHYAKTKGDPRTLKTDLARAKTRVHYAKTKGDHQTRVPQREQRTPKTDLARDRVETRVQCGQLTEPKIGTRAPCGG